MYRYAQINEQGFVVANSYLAGEVIADNMIRIADDFDISNKKYINGNWVEYTPDPLPEEHTQSEAEKIQANQLAVMEALADIAEMLISK